MLAKRIIARLDIKPPNLVKGIRLEGLRKIGDPHEYANRYYKDGADEILYMDVDASLDGRCGISDLVRRTSDGIFIPVTVGGGLRSVADLRNMALSGADKCCINTGAIRNPYLITDAARSFGSQFIVVAIEYSQGRCFTDNGREYTGLDAYDWARRAVDFGAGELLLTCIDREGLRRGGDVEFVYGVTQAVGVPVIAHGGIATAQHVSSMFNAGADAVCLASALHYNHTTISELKKAINDHPVRAA